MSHSDPQARDPAELTDAELEAVAAGKAVGRLYADIMFTAPLVAVGVLPRSALKDPRFGRWSV